MKIKKGGANTVKLKIMNFELWFFVFSFQFLVILGLCGCSSVISPYIVSVRREPPIDANLSEGYYKVELKKSGALNVLPIINKPESELLSQSRSVVASLGQSKDGYKTWFNMVAFDEVRLTAKRKYFFLVDEKVKRLSGKRKFLPFEPKKGLMFDCQMVLETAALNKGRAAENARQIAILRQVLKNLHKDINELGQGVDMLDSDNKMLSISGMLLNQIFGTVLHKLNRSPALATKLGDAEGIEFDHISFNKGTIRMVVEGDIVTATIRLGVFKGMFENQERGPAIEDIESIDLEDYQ